MPPPPPKPPMLPRGRRWIVLILALFALVFGVSGAVAGIFPAPGTATAAGSLRAGSS